MSEMNVTLPVTIQLKRGETVEFKANTDMEKIGEISWGVIRKKLQSWIPIFQDESFRAVEDAEKKGSAVLAVLRDRRGICGRRMMK